MVVVRKVTQYPERAMATEPLTPAEIRRIDAQYTPFSSFEEWAELHVDEDLWTRYAARLNDERDRASDQTFLEVRQKAIRTAAIDTGAIEGLYQVDRGFTETVAIEAAAWQAKARERGEKVEAYFAAQLQTYELVLDAATGAQPISEAWIRRIHEEICAAQTSYTVHTSTGEREQPLPKGSYKTQPNHVTLPDGSTHAYAPVDDTAPEMGRFVTEISGTGFLTAHSVLQAAYSHYVLTAIHPFADGNGRVARAVASLFFYRAASIPLVVFADQTGRYYDVLAEADDRRFQGFADFVRDCGLDTLAVATESLREARSPRVEDALRGLRSTVASHGGLTHTEVDEVGNRLVASCLSALKHAIAELPPLQGVSVIAQPVSGSASTGRTGYRQLLSNPTFLQLAFQSQPPATASIQVTIQVVISLTTGDAVPIVIERLDSREVLEVRLAEVHPQQSAALQAHLASFARSVLADNLATLREQATEALRNAGYR